MITLGIMLLQKEMTRKEFLALIGTSFGALMMSALPLIGASNHPLKKNSSSYGNGTYGGTSK